MRLDEMKKGDKGILISYNNQGYIELKRHLLGMGFVKGSEIELEKVAPLGDPIELKIKGYSICLRKEEAKNIEVELISN